MKNLGFAAAAFVLLGTTGCTIGQPNVYALPQAEVISRLAHVDVEPSGSGPFFMLDLHPRRSGSDKVIWSATGSQASHRCEIRVTPVEAESSRVDISCSGGGAGDGAAAGLVVNMIRKRAIELIDATLEQRPFDPHLAEGATAFGWPEDVVDHGSYADAVGQAVAMDQSTRAATSGQGR